MNLIDEHMIRQFRRVPETGTTLEEPLTGWRIERVENGRMVNVHGNNELRAKPCKESTLPLGIPSPLPYGHAAPHPRCQCGIRVVGDIRELSNHWTRSFRTVAAAGLGIKDAYGTDQLALCRVEASGFVTEGHAMPADDPFTTVRTGRGRVTEVYTPTWTDAHAVSRSHPGLPVRPLASIPDNLFRPLQEEEPPQTTLAYQSHRHHIRVRTGVTEVMVPRTHLQSPEIREAVWGAVRAERVGNEHMRTLIELLVVPLTDLTDPQEMHGCAWGMAVALAQQATREAA